MRPFLPLAVAIAVAGCSQPATLTVEDAWVRLPAAPGRPGAAYFTLKGGPEAAQLLSVTSPVVIRTELHDSMMMAGSGSGGHGGAHSMATMRPIAGPVPVPANGTVRFAPGGRHVMLFNVNPGITPARRVTLLFTFTDGRRLTVNAPAVAAGAPAPGAD